MGATGGCSSATQAKILETVSTQTAARWRILIDCLFIWDVPLDLRDTHLMAIVRVPVPPAKISLAPKLGTEIGSMHTF